MELLKIEENALNSIVEAAVSEKANSVEFKDLQEVLKMDGISINSREFLNEVESYLSKKGISVNYRLNESVNYKSNLRLKINESLEDFIDDYEMDSKPMSIKEVYGKIDFSKLPPLDQKKIQGLKVIELKSEDISKIDDAGMEKSKSQFCLLELKGRYFFVDNQGYDFPKYVAELTSFKKTNEAFDETFDKHQLKVDLYTDDDGAIGKKEDLEGDNITLLYKKGVKFTYDVKDKTFEAPDGMVVDVAKNLFEEVTLKQGEYTGGELNEHCEEDIKAFLNSVVEDSWKQEDLDALVEKITAGDYNPMRAKELTNMITTFALTVTSANAGEEQNIDLHKQITDLSNELHGLSEGADEPQDLTKEDVAKVLNDISVNGFEVEGSDVKIIEPSMITDDLANSVNQYAKSFSKNEGFDAKDVDIVETPTEDKEIYMEGLLNICKQHDIIIK